MVLVIDRVFLKTRFAPRVCPSDPGISWGGAQSSRQHFCQWLTPLKFESRKSEKGQKKRAAENRPKGQSHEGFKENGPVIDTKLGPYSSFFFFHAKFGQAFTFWGHGGPDSCGALSAAAGTADPLSCQCARDNQKNRRTECSCPTENNKSVAKTHLYYRPIWPTI